MGKFHKTSNKKCGCVQYMQGGTCLSRQHNLHAGAFKEETSRSKSKSRREVSVLHLLAVNLFIRECNNNSNDNNNNNNIITVILFVLQRIKLDRA